MKKLVACAASLAVSVSAMAQMPHAAAAEECSLPEVMRAWSRPGRSLPGGMERDPNAPAGETGQPYRASLVPCSGAYCKAGSHATIVAMDIPAAGRYRVAVDQPVWIDILTETGKAEGVMCEHTGCRPLRKIVQFDLQPGRHWVNLVSGQPGEVGVLLVRMPDQPENAPAPAQNAFPMSPAASDAADGHTAGRRP